MTPADLLAALEAAEADLVVATKRISNVANIPSADSEVCEIYADLIVAYGKLSRVIAALRARGVR